MTGSRTYGYDVSVRTSAAPEKPASDARQDTHAKAATYEGTASGSVSTTAQARAPGTSVRTTSHADATPTTTQAAVTAAASPTLRTTRSRVRCCQTSCQALDHPSAPARSTR
jgi:hypothetical protein